ncbi:MAG: FKBP-type peptidyl-prolyl cis-trans isomerase [Polyangiales bacterium]
MTPHTLRTTTARRIGAGTFALVVSSVALVAACKPAGSMSGGTAASASVSGSVASAAPKPSGLPAPADVAAVPADAPKTASGLASKVIQPGTGKDHPTANDFVKVNYTGWTTDGVMFDSSVAPKQPGRRPEPAQFGLNAVIEGWTEGVQLMVVGEKRRFWIPQELAYKGQAGAPAGMLVFEVELLDFTPGPKPPADVKAAPADAIKEKNGLASKIVTPGTGKVHPGANDDVKLNFAIWTPDGKMLDSNTPPGAKPGDPKPVQRTVTWVIDGWAQAVELMVVGEKRLVWVPADLAFKGKPGAPQTDLVLELELTEIIPGPETPKDVAAPPKDATTEKSGLAWKVLTKGTGTTHPTAANSVVVIYAGWTTDGKMFDASIKKAPTATLNLSSVIPGWTEGMQLMVEGEKRRFWIPEALAYKGQPGKPKGMLVFDVELQKIGPASPPRGMGPGGMGGMGGMGMPGSHMPPAPKPK